MKETTEEVVETSNDEICDEDTSKAVIEAQDAVNFIKRSLKEAFEKHKVVARDQVYKIFEVTKAQEGFVIEVLHKDGST